jgi:hypothetical protein
VTIRTKEPDVPNHFPPAKLFLDDIEEIVTILVETVENPEPTSTPPPEDAKTMVTIAAKDRICDVVSELPNIARRTAELSISVERSGWDVTVLRITESDAHLLFGLYSREKKLGVFHKVEPIFRRRNLWLRTLVWSHYVPSLGAVTSTSLAAIGLLAAFLFNVPFHHPTRVLVLESLVVLTAITLWWTLSHHSIIILRHSSEPSPIRQELLHKFPLVALSSALTFLLTLLGLYLKHKYWP